jgi:hypothetical protein
VPDLPAIFQLGREKYLAAILVGKQVAQRAFRRTVCRSGIDQLAALREQLKDDFFKRGFSVCVLRHLKGVGRPQTDNRNELPGMRDGATGEQGRP